MAGFMSLLNSMYFWYSTRSADVYRAIMQQWIWVVWWRYVWVNVVCQLSLNVDPPIFVICFLISDGADTWLERPLFVGLYFYFILVTGL